MTMKQMMKRIIPTTAWVGLRNLKGRLCGARAEGAQSKRFKRWYSRDESTDKTRVETRLAFDIHRLEKGLSHVGFRDGFGKGVLAEISKRMVLLEKADSNYEKNPLYLQGLAVLHEYQHRHEEDGYDLSEAKCLFPGRNEAQALSTVIGVKNDLDGRVAAGIENLTRVNAFNYCHNYSL